MNSKEKARKFLEEIKAKEKVALVFHDDLDGFASGVMVYDYLVKKGCEVKYSSFVLSKSDLKEVLVSFDNPDKLIVMDIAPNLIAEDLEELSKKMKILYIDHHQKVCAICNEVTECRPDTGYIPVARLVFEILGKPEEQYWLAVAAVMADEGDKYEENMQFINRFLKLSDKDLKFYKEEVAQKLSNFLSYFKNNTYEAFNILKDINNFDEVKKVYKYSEPVENEIKKWTESFEKDKEEINGTTFYYLAPKYSIKVAIINKVCGQHPDEILLFASPAGEKIGVSTRNQNQRVNMVELLKKAVEGIEDSTSGGHPAAAGASFPSKYLSKFKENLAKLNLEEFSVGN